MRTNQDDVSFEHRPHTHEKTSLELGYLRTISLTIFVEIESCPIEGSISGTKHIRGTSHPDPLRWSSLYNDARTSLSSVINTPPPLKALNSSIHRSKALYELIPLRIRQHPAFRPNIRHNAASSTISPPNSVLHTRGSPHALVPGLTCQRRH